MTPAISGPVPPFQNLPIQANWYKPNAFIIDDIVLGRLTLVQTVIDHNYVIGQAIRLHIPDGYGCVQLNNLQGIVVEIPASNQVYVTIDSSQNVNNFITAVSQVDVPQICPIGDVNTGNISNTGRIMKTYIPGSFQNISPGIGVIT